MDFVLKIDFRMLTGIILLKSSLGVDLVCISTPCYRVNFQVILKGKVSVIQKSMLQFSNSR